MWQRDLSNTDHSSSLVTRLSGYKADEKNIDTSDCEKKHLNVVMNV